MKDRQNVNRGACKGCNECREYTMYSINYTKQSCEYCHCVPAVHTNLDQQATPNERFQQTLSDIASPSLRRKKYKRKKLNEKLDKRLDRFYKSLLSFLPIRYIVSIEII